MVSEIWSELPYIIGCGWWWIIFPALIIIFPWVVFYWYRESSIKFTIGDVVRCIIASFISVVVVICYIAACAVYIRDHPNVGIHEWRDGSGPRTVCYYEVRSEFVGIAGKGGHNENHTYTVCRDQGE